MTLQDLSPLNLSLYGKCYQKINFNVSDNIEIDLNNNFFEIQLLNFTGCFVERAAIENDFVVVNNDKLHWQDMDFKKVK